MSLLSWGETPPDPPGSLRSGLRMSDFIFGGKPQGKERSFADPSEASKGSLGASLIELPGPKDLGIQAVMELYRFAACRAKRDSGGLGEDPPGSTMTY